MEHNTLPGLSGVPAVAGGLVVPVGRSRPRQDARCQSNSAGTRAQDHSPQPKHIQILGKSPERGASERNRITTTATDNSPDQTIDRDTGPSVAVAHRDPQITHAHATSCEVYTCRQFGWS